MTVERMILLGLAWTAFLSLIGVVLVYGLLTPWYKSRTGIGFMSTKIAFSVTIGLTIAGGYGIRLPMWAIYACWVSIILAVNWGITWNIIYKQFLEHRTDEMRNKEPTGGKAGVIKGTGEPRRSTKGKTNGDYSR